MVKINILGSCVSRVAMLKGDGSGHGLMDENMKLGYFLDKENMVLAMMPPAFDREEVESLVKEEMLWDKSRIKVVKQSLNKDTLGLLMEEPADYLIIDLMDFQTNFVVKGDTAFDSNAYEFFNTALFDKYKDSVSVANFMKLPHWFYYPYVDLFFKQLMERYDSEHIILNRFRANSYYIAKDGFIKEIPEDYRQPYQANAAYNGQLGLLEEHIIKNFNPYVIDISKFYIGDENIWENLQGAHFEREFYERTFEIVRHIIYDRPEKKVFDSPVFFENKEKYGFAFDRDRGIEVMEQLVNAGDISWLSVLDKLYRNYRGIL